MIAAFIYLSEKYKSNADDPVRLITNYYDLELDDEHYPVITGGQFINLIQNGKSIILIGSKTSSWSKEFVRQVDEDTKDLDIDKIYLEIIKENSEIKLPENINYKENKY